MKKMISRISVIGLMALGFLFTLTNDVYANTTKTTPIPQIRLSNLQSFRGAYVTRYFAVGLQNNLPTQSNQVNLDEVDRGTKTTVQINADQVDFPATQLARLSNGRIYNKVLFVVHKNPEFSWVNPNGRIPRGETASKSNLFLAVDHISYLDFLDLVSASPNGEWITYSFHTTH